MSELMPENPDSWTFLTNHAHVLLCLAQDPEIRLCDVAAEVGLTERGVQRIVKELATSGYITRERNGRRNRYLVHARQPLRRSIARHRQVGDLLQLITQRRAAADS
ncbi:helix-turn-helix transcriptional regulator [Nannocystis exedens]|nr:winged helix-turn-helix transcriptional regulator [Nannocystis exedens]